MDTQTPPSPIYRIFRDKHGIPQFEPKRGTQALKDALIYSFPTLETELQLMQAALRKFFDSERGSTFVFELPERDLQTSLAKKRDIPVTPAQPNKSSLRSWKVSRASRTPSRPSSRASSRAPSRASSRCETPTQFPDFAAPVNGGTMTTWLLSSGQELEKRKRQPYDPVKRRKVAENRGNACEKHRAAKTTCNPEECPQNKLYGKMTGRPRRESESSAYDTPAESSILFHTPKENDTPSMLQTDQTSSIDSSAQLDLDIFFDAPDPSQNNPLLQANAQPEYPLMSDPTWPAPLDVNDMSWSDLGVYPVIPDTLPEKEHFITQVMNMETIEEHHPPTFEAQDLHAVPEEPIQQMQDVTMSDSTTLEQALATFNASDDPFMGWANKRASNLIDEYGWVLSHVEAL